MRRTSFNDPNIARRTAELIDAAPVELPDGTARALRAYRTCVTDRPAELHAALSEAEAMDALVAAVWKAAMRGQVQLDTLDFGGLDEAAEQASKARRGNQVRARLYEQAHGRFLDAVQKDAGKLIGFAQANHAKIVASMFAVSERLPANVTEETVGSATAQQHQDVLAFSRLVSQAELLHTLVRELDDSHGPAGSDHTKCRYLEYTNIDRVFRVSFTSARSRRLNYPDSEWGTFGSVSFWRQLVAYSEPGDIWLVQHETRDRRSAELWPAKRMTGEQLREAQAAQAALAHAQQMDHHVAVQLPHGMGTATF